MKQPQDSETFIAEHRKLAKEDVECASESYNRGVALMEQEKLDEAEAAFRDAIGDSARMFEAWVNLGYIYFKKGDLPQVVEANRRAVEIEPR